MEQQKHIYCMIHVILAKSTDTEPFVQARLYTPYFLYNVPPIAPENANSVSSKFILVFQIREITLITLITLKG